MKKIVALGLALTLAVSVFTGCQKNDAELAGDEVALVEAEKVKVIANVNGVDIPFERYEKYFSIQSYELEKEHGMKIWNVERDGKTMKEIRQGQTIDYLVRVELIEKYVKSNDFVVDEKVITEVYAKYMESIKNDSERKTYYEENGIDESFLRRFLEDQMYLRVFEDQVLAQTYDSEETMNELFENRYIRYKTSHILVDKKDKELLEAARSEMVTVEESEEETTSETDNEDSTDEDTADEVVDEEIIENHDLDMFVAKAREISIHSTSAVKGGELGFVTIGNMPFEYEKVALSIELYTISPIIETEYGYHLLFVDDRMMLSDMIDNGMKEEEINTYKDEIIEKYASIKSKKIYSDLENNASTERFLELLVEEN